MSMKPLFTKEANEEAFKWIESKGYLLDVSGNLLRDMSKDFILTAYCLTKSDGNLTVNCNVTEPAYAI